MTDYRSESSSRLSSRQGPRSQRADSTTSSCLPMVTGAQQPIIVASHKSQAEGEGEKPPSQQSPRKPPVTQPSGGGAAVPRPPQLSRGGLGSQQQNRSSAPTRHYEEILGPAPVDDATQLLIINSLKNRIYQRSVNLRKTYRELDADGNGLIPIPGFVDEMARSYSLTAVEKYCLQRLLLQADYRNDGAIDYGEFCDILKMHDHAMCPELTAGEKKRLQEPGFLDPRMQKMMSNDALTIRVTSGMPTNELGHMTIECPFGVLGDSEKMDAVIGAFFHDKVGQLRAVFERHDADRDGYVTYPQFRASMKELDRYVFDEEIDDLIHVLDKKKKGLISVEAFMGQLSREYMKKKAHRSNMYESPFVWQEHKPSKPPTAQHGSRAGSTPMHGGDGSQPRSMSGSAEGKHRRIGRPQETRSSQLRSRECKTKIADWTKQRELFGKGYGSDDAWAALAEQLGERHPATPRTKLAGTGDSAGLKLPSIPSREQRKRKDDDAPATAR